MRIICEIAFSVPVITSAIEAGGDIPIRQRIFPGKYGRTFCLCGCKTGGRGCRSYIFPYLLLYKSFFARREMPSPPGVLWVGI
jgi:hypothetical protein